MDQQHASSVAQAISDSINFSSPGESWQHLSFTSSVDWARELLARVAVLVGEQSIAYASGLVSATDSGAAGDIIVFGSNSIVRATFSAEPQASSSGELILEADVWAEPRSNLSKVKAKMTSPIGDDDSLDWPQRLEAIAVFADGSEVTLPRAKYTKYASSAGLAAFLFDPFVHL